MTVTSAAPNNAKRLRHVLTAAVFVTALVLGPAATAEADWDIGAYDACLARKGLPAGTEDYTGDCCAESGGQWSLQQVKCVAPPAVEEALPPQPQKPPRPVNPVPPGNIQAPAPVSPGAPVNPGNFG